MKYGLDYLAGATYKELILAYHPKGFSAGFFLHTFGNAFPVIRKLAQTGKCPEIRVHSIWDDLHQWKDDYLKTVKQDLKKLCTIAKEHQAIKFQFSPMCEHNMAKTTIQPIMDKLKKIIQKQEVSNVILVNCVYKGATLKSDKMLISEIHGKKTKPEGKFNYSFDGLDACTYDAEELKKTYSDAETFYFWTAPYNLKRKTSESITVKDRINRDFRPCKAHIEALVAMSQKKGETNCPDGEFLVKPLSEDCGDVKSNKLCLLTKAEYKEVLLVRNNKARTVVDKLTLVNPKYCSYQRWYSKYAGYEMAKKNMLLIAGDGKILNTGYGKDVLIDPRFRNGGVK